MIFMSNSIKAEMRQIPEHMQQDMDTHHLWFRFSPGISLEQGASNQQEHYLHLHP